MSEWQETTLGDLITLQRGHDLAKTEMQIGSIPVAGSNGVIGYHNKATTKALGITIGRSGNIGNPHLYKEDFWAHNTTLYVKDFKSNDEIFVYYLLKSIDFAGFNVGSAVPTLNRNHIHPMVIQKPSPKEQKAIASVLSSLDDKIDLLRRQNTTLERIAVTLFRQWFIEETQEDWEEKSLKEVVDIAIGRTPPRQEHQWFSESEVDVKWISIKDLGNDGAFLFKTSEYLTKTAIARFNIPVIPKDTVVLSFKMTVGRVAITSEEMLSNEAIAHFKFKANTPFTKEYLFLFLKTYKWELLGSTSSIVTAINSAMIKDLEIFIPDVASMFKFKEATEPLFGKIKSNQQQIQTLEKLRDNLLPKLMSGEIRLVLH